MSSNVVTQKSRIGKMLLSLGAIAVVERAVFFVNAIYSRRVLGATAVGKYSWAAAVVSYFLLFINPGLETIAKRDVSRNPDQAAYYSSSLLVLQTLLAVAGLAILSIISITSNRGEDVNKLLFIQGLALLIIPLDFGWLLQARERTSFIAIVNVVLQMLQIPVLILIMRGPSDIFLYAILPYPFKIALVGITAWYCLRTRLIDWKQLRLSIRGLLPLLSEAIPIGISQAAVLLYYNTDAILLGIWHGDRIVGLYTSAYKLMLLATFVNQATIPAFFPSLSRSIDDPNRAKDVSAAFLRFHAWIGFSAAAVNWAAGRHIMKLMYGAGYEEFGLAYEVLCLNLPLIFINVGLITPLTAWKKQKLHLSITLTAAIINVAFNFVLIPRFGYTAAIGTTLSSEIVVLICGGIARRAYVVPLRWERLIAAPLLTSVVLALTIRWAIMYSPGKWLLWTVLFSTAFVAALAWIERELYVPNLTRLLRRGVATPFQPRVDITLTPEKELIM